MTITRVRVWLLVWGLLGTVVVACTVPHTMQVRPFGYDCPPNEPVASTVSVSWLSPALKPDTMGIQQWCVTVGPPVIDSLPDARLPIPGPDDTLTVVTWNILGGAGDLAGFLAEELSYVCDGRRSRPDPGFNPFILLVQEAYRRSTTVPEFPDSDREANT